MVSCAVTFELIFAFLNMYFIVVGIFQFCVTIKTSLFMVFGFIVTHLQLTFIAYKAQLGIIVNLKEARGTLLQSKE